MVISVQRGRSSTIGRDHRDDRSSMDFMCVYFRNIKEINDKLNNIDRCVYAVLRALAEELIADNYSYFVFYACMVYIYNNNNNNTRKK